MEFEAKAEKNAEKKHQKTAKKLKKIAVFDKILRFEKILN